ncbi:MAG: hypothetical protein BMS9Abin29_0551 [Gemmatimonadota bacterium]|nr:MAG: hypothetical protein BMS9Abin29_0551 [Gemmatimonadota bacterium]
MSHFARIVSLALIMGAGACGDGADRAPPFRYPAGSRERPEGLGSRGSAAGFPSVFAIDPKDHVGQTFEATPTLYAYVTPAEGGEDRVRLLVRVVPFRSPFIFDGPAIEVAVPAEEGLVPIYLEGSELRLLVDTLYAWQVTALQIVDGDERVDQAEGYIVRIPEAVGGMPQSGTGAGHTVWLIEQGVWYDAFAAVAGGGPGWARSRDEMIERARGLVAQPSGS